MRADEPITWIEVETQSSFSNRNYINQLRYERLMAKAEMFLNYSRYLAQQDIYYPNHTNERNRLCRIAVALEARAKKIKEGM